MPVASNIGRSGRVREGWRGRVILLCLISGPGLAVSQQTSNPPTIPRWLPATVARVIDGDTVEVWVEGKTERVRLLRVNTPESVHPDSSRNVPFGKKAARYARKRLAGKEVFLEFEGKRRDHYGRLLAYVWVDAELFNLALVHDCMSPFYRRFGEGRYGALFTAAEADAKDRKCGVWRIAPPQP